MPKVQHSFTGKSCFLNTKKQVKVPHTSGCVLNRHAGQNDTFSLIYVILVKYPIFTLHGRKKSFLRWCRRMALIFSPKG
jgi:hypothetical protein